MNLLSASHSKQNGRQTDCSCLKLKLFFKKVNNYEYVIIVIYQTDSVGKYRALSVEWAI